MNRLCRLADHISPGLDQPHAQHTAAAGASGVESAPPQPQLLLPPDNNDLDPLLTPAQIEDFKRDGYVLKRWGGTQYAGESSSLIQRLQDYLWSTFPEGVRRDDKSTWTDPHLLESWQRECRPRGDEADYVTATAKSPGWKWHQAGLEPWIRDMMHGNSWITGVVEQMVGGPLRTAQRSRGVYNLFPQSDHKKAAQLGPHHDTCNSQVIVMMLVDHVPPHSGGFTVWPGSHIPLYYAHKDEWHWSPTEDNSKILAEIVATTQPAEITGRAGDVCFMHGRTVHSGGQHFNPEVVRMAMFADFQQDRPVRTDTGNPPDTTWTIQPNSGFNQWWHDTRRYVDDCPIQEDMWASWKI